MPKKKCPHDKQKYFCKECGGSQICEHDIRRSRCKKCGGSEICEHDIRRSECKKCGGSSICEHDKYKSLCKKCGGSKLCKTPLCETRAIKKYKGHCLPCFMQLYPDEPVARNYKTKEQSVVEFIKQNFDLTWICDKKIQDGCSLKRPDCIVDLGSHVLVVEIDENQHRDYDCSCENKRLMELSQDIGHRPMVFVRFNPDAYLMDDKKITSCWSVGKDGILRVSKKKVKEWEFRLNTLKEQIEYWISNATDKTVEVVQLFYDIIKTDSSTS